MIHVYFNPHSPCGERHAARDSRFEQVISIHTPLAGSDEYTLSSSSTEPISIHTPLAGSDAHEVTYLVVVVISIHTPLAGSDAPDCNRSGTESYFNPHSPCGERLAHAELHNRLVISIHTPLAGSDPHRAQRVAADPISIHTPLAGSDRQILRSSTSCGISIHTPLAGSDRASSRFEVRRAYFNPHSPCGERLADSTPSKTSMTHFNPHSPCGERHDTVRHVDFINVISIHTPLAGSDSGLPKSPNDDDISIHTPLAGSDFTRLSRSCASQ